MSGKSDPVNDNGAGAPCPICKKPEAARYRPFCSKRCADVDLHRWLSGAYAVPAVETDDDPGDLGGAEHE